MSNLNTAYDDSFRTLLTDCKRLVVPLVNEVFGENWADNERVELYQNEVFITAGGDKKRITDSNFTIGNNSRRYHIECQSSNDGTIVVRVFEYASQIAVTTAEQDVSETAFTLPASGILYLRSTNNTPDKHTIVIDTPGGKISYEVPILKVQDYDLDEILEKRLFFLIPFYFFRFSLNEMEENETLIQNMVQIYRELWRKLELLVEAGTLSEYENLAIKAMCDKVAQALVVRHKNVKEGVDNIMGGQVLDYEAKRIYLAAKEEGMQQGIMLAIFKLVAEGDYDVNRGAQKLNLTVEEFCKQMEEAGFKVPVMNV